MQKKKLSKIYRQHIKYNFLMKNRQIIKDISSYFHAIFKNQAIIQAKKSCAALNIEALIKKQKENEEKGILDDRGYRQFLN